LLDDAVDATAPAGDKAGPWRPEAGLTNGQPPQGWPYFLGGGICFLLQLAAGAEATITVVIFCWHICLISESMGHHDSEIMDDRSID
jgi:hypothetical protein